MTQVTPVYLTPDDMKSLYFQRVAASIRCEEEVNRKKAFSQIAVAEATEKVIRRLVVLCGDESAQPVVNTGTLHH